MKVIVLRLGVKSYCLGPPLSMFVVCTYTYITCACAYQSMCADIHSHLDLRAQFETPRSWSMQVALLQDDDNYDNDCDCDGDDDCLYHDCHYYDSHCCCTTTTTMTTTTTTTPPIPACRTASTTAAIGAASSTRPLGIAVDDATTIHYCLYCRDCCRDCCFRHQKDRKDNIPDNRQDADRKKYVCSYCVLHIYTTCLYLSIYYLSVYLSIYLSACLYPYEH